METYRFNIPRKIIIAIVVTVFVHVLFISIPLFKAFEWQMFDFLIKKRGEKKPDKRIVLIVEDDVTASTYGWPLPRRHYAALLDSLRSYGAGVTSFDILFNDRTDFDNDTVFVNAVIRADNVIHTMTTDIFSGEQEYDPLEAVCNDTPYSKFAITLPSDSRRKFYNASYAIFPHEQFLEFFKYIGHVTSVQDEDGRFRRTPLILHYNGCFYASFGIKTIYRYFDTDDENYRIFDSMGGEKLVLHAGQDSIIIPINNKGQAVLNPYGDLNAFPNYTISDVLQGKITPEKFTGKIVLVGKIVTGDRDSFVTPFSADCSGIVLHATEISNILDRTFIREIPLVINLFILLLFSLFIALYPYHKYGNLLYLSSFPLIWIVILCIMQYLLLKFEIGIWMIKIVQLSFTTIITFFTVNILERLEADRIITVKDAKVEYLKSLLVEKNEQQNIIEQIKNFLVYILEKSSVNFQDNLDQQVKILDNKQNKLYSEISEKIDSFALMGRQIDDKINRILSEIDETQEENRLIKRHEKNIGQFAALEIYVKRHTINILGNRGATGEIKFPPVNMAFIFYLANARLKKKEWISNSEITKKQQAYSASCTFNHLGVMGCMFIGRKNDEPQFQEKVNIDDYEPDAGKIRRYGCEINKEIKRYLKNNRLSSESEYFIRTPNKELVQDGRYFLVESINDIKIIK